MNKPSKYSGRNFTKITVVTRIVNFGKLPNCRWTYADLIRVGKTFEQQVREVAKGCVEWPDPSTWRPLGYHLHYSKANM